jgi:putative nucleotidyltransferase with HDIG domain
LIFGLSYALDIAGKNNLSHSKSTAYLSVLVGREMGLAEEAIVELYYAALLHDIGMGITYEMKQHCLEGERMIKELPLSEEIARSIHYHHEYDDGTGLFGLVRDEIPQYSAIISFTSDFDDLFGKHADVFDAKLYLFVCEWLDKNRHTYDRRILEAFQSLIKRETFLLDYFNHETKYILAGKVMIDDDVYYEYDEIVKFANCFADIIDRRSPFTYTHSHGIAGLARRAAEYLGYDEEKQNTMYLAGLLHDIGKLYVSPDILHKNGKLEQEERFEINKHTYYTRKILEQIEGFEELVNFAANHHETPGGTGYPNHIAEDGLGELDRVMAVCDVYQALTEERPYRKGLEPEKAWGIIDEMVEKQQLDGVLVGKLKGVFVGETVI